MASLTATVLTPHASRYLQQLCKHWGHRFDAEFDATRGRVDFGDDSDVQLSAGEEALILTVTGAEERLDELAAIVAEHLNRFAHREGEFLFDWQR